MEKNLILAYATNCKFQDFAVFIRSARRHCSPNDVDIVVITNPMGREYSELADRHKVELYPAYTIWQQIRHSVQMRAFYRIVLALCELFPRYPLLFGDQEVLESVHRIIAHPWIYAQAQRFLNFEDFLKVRCNYGLVLLSDARDVVFQSNPFFGLRTDVLHVALQGPAETYGLDNIDSKWMKQVLGSQIFEELRGKPSSCCGTTIGGYDVLMEYLSKLNSLIIRNKRKAVEQPMHNKIVYLDIPSDKVILHQNACGPFITLGGMSVAEFELTDMQLLAGGKTVPIVHMYDRIAETKALFSALYGSY